MNLVFLTFKVSLSAMTGFDSYHNSFFVREQEGLQLKVHECSIISIHSGFRIGYRQEDH